MAKRNFRVALFGASGVGKTYFLASYFYATRHLSQGNYQINAVEGSQERISWVTERLFNPERIIGTSGRVQYTFDVPKKDMRITLFDVPGGTTTTVDYVPEETLDDIHNANAVMFFFPADVVLRNAGETMRQADVFINQLDRFDALNRWRKEKKDIPVYFIFTQGDKIKDEKVKVKELMKKIRGTADRAGYDTTWWKVPFKWFWRRGKYTRGYISQSLGQWDGLKPPTKEQYEPENVIEPMEDLFDDLKSAF